MIRTWCLFILASLCVVYCSCDPSITNVQPDHGVVTGGTTIKATGENFRDGAEVTVGGNDATEENFVSSTELTAKVPPGAVGAADVAVTNPDGRSGTLSEGFIYTERPVGPFAVVRITPTGTFAMPAAVPTDTQFTVTFTNPMDVTSVTPSNITLEDQDNGGLVDLTLVRTYNARTIVLEPTVPLQANNTYLLTVIDGPNSVRDTVGQSLQLFYDSVFRTTPPSPEPLFEGMHYLKTLSMTRWEIFPILAPTASGRKGFATVIPSTRKLLLTEVDVATPGRGIDVAITRIYRNNDQAASGMFGNNWHFIYDSEFQVVADMNGDGTVEFIHRSADGRLFTYESQYGSSNPRDHKSPPGFYDTLKTVTVSGKKFLVRRTKRGMEYFYEFHRQGNAVVEDPDNLPIGSVGYLMQIRDRNGNTISIDRHAADDLIRPSRIREIVDDLDRTTVFTYSTSQSQEDLVTKVEQFRRTQVRSWLYSYDTNRSLIAVSTPESVWLDEGTMRANTRKVRRYTYAGTGGRFNLIGIEDGRGNESMKIHYDGNNDVAQIDYGSEPDAGTALYSYKRVAGVNQATQIDRNGNVLEVQHESTNTPPFWNIHSTRSFTRGLHPTLPFPEPEFYMTFFVHDSDSEVIESPNTNVQRWIRDDNGNVIQHIFKAATRAELLQNGPDYKREEDIVWTFAYEPEFNQLIRITEPRGNNTEFVGTANTVVAQTEDVLAQAPRIFRNIDGEKRNAYTSFYYYDHEDISNRLAADSAAVGDTAAFARNFPLSFGRTAPNQFHDPPDPAVFSDRDSDGFVDRGGNLYAIREQRPRVVDPNTGQFLVDRQVIERNFTHNQFGQRILEIEPDGNRNRLEWFLGSFDLVNNPNRGYLSKFVVATKYSDTDLDVNKGIPVTGPSGLGLELVDRYTYDVVGNVVTWCSDSKWTKMGAKEKLADEADVVAFCSTPPQH